MGMGMVGNDVGENGNGNEVLDWECEWDGNGNDSMEIGTTIIIPAHLYSVQSILSVTVGV